MLGGRCRITDKIQQLIIVTVSQGTVWKQGEFEIEASTRCTKHPLLGSLIPSFSRKGFCTIHLYYKDIDLQRMSKRIG